MKKIIMTMAGLLTGLAIAGSDKAATLAVYEEGILYATIACPMMLELSTQRGTADEYGKTDWQACIAEAKRDTKTHFDSALKSIKKTRARAALKEHYITAIATITSLAPEHEEMRVTYQQRQAQNKNKLTEKWTRFELEN